MLSPDIILSFFGIAIVLALSPGPDNIFVLTQSMIWGRLSGILVVLGLCVGLIGHTVAVTAGVAALFRASPTAFTLLKAAGALYLLYLAWHSLRAALRTGSSPSLDAVPHQPAYVLFRRGIIMNLTNPKVSLFFLAFLPQFTSPARGSVALQTLSLGALFILATLLVFGIIALLAGMVGERLQRSQHIQRILNGLAGLIFIALAAILILSGPAS